MMIALVLLGTITTLFFGFVCRQSRHLQEIMNAAELNETVVFATSEIRALISSARFEGISACGKRLTLFFQDNRVEVYPQNRSLLVRHKGASNPIAEFCVAEKTGFEWRVNEHGRGAVVVTLVFEGDGRERKISFPVVPLVDESQAVPDEI